MEVASIYIQPYKIQPTLAVEEHDHRLLPVVSNCWVPQLKIISTPWSSPSIEMDPLEPLSSSATCEMSVFLCFWIQAWTGFIFSAHYTGQDGMGRRSWRVLLSNVVAEGNPMWEKSRTKKKLFPCWLFFDFANSPNFKGSTFAWDLILPPNQILDSSDIPINIKRLSHAGH